MINLSFYDGVSLVFNVNDWYELRTKYRIVGEFIGATRTIPIALPSALCPEETYLLIKKGVAKLVKWENLYCVPSLVDKEKFQTKLNQSFEEQKVIFVEDRKMQLENLVDTIILGKKRESAENVSKDDILRTEMSKFPILKEENMVSCICTQHPEYLRGTATDVSTSNLFNYTNKLKCAVYEDLWDKGYYITSGRKFGGDFLVYLGDPVSYHAVYIVKCVQGEESHNVSEIIAYGRIGTSVKKKFVLASLNSEEKVSYIALSWLDA
ncbi:tRNA splicing endonuclease subunit 34 [Carabus blaptoides fortunei]